MSEISDKLIDATFKSVIPYITPWRIIFTATSLSVISSGNWSINSKIAGNASLKTISTSFIEHVTTMPLWELLLTIGITAYLIPKISNFLTFSAIKLIHIPRCESAIAELVKLKSIRPSKLTRSFKNQIAELYQHEKKCKAQHTTISTRTRDKPGSDDCIKLHRRKYQSLKCWHPRCHRLFYSIIFSKPKNHPSLFNKDIALFDHQGWDAKNRGVPCHQGQHISRNINL